MARKRKSVSFDANTTSTVTITTGIVMLEIDKIRRDGGTQMRPKIDQELVNQYAADMQRGDEFPAVVVWYDGATYWLSSGFHRTAAAEQLELKAIKADVRSGQHRDAMLHAASGTNAEHGKRRTRAETRNQLMTLLRDEEWSKWSDREIARRVKVDHKTVGKLRAEMAVSGEIPQIETRKVERGGKVYEQKTANIGTSRSAQKPSSETQPNGELSKNGEIDGPHPSTNQMLSGEFPQIAETELSVLSGEIPQIDTQSTSQRVTLEMPLPLIGKLYTLVQQSPLANEEKQLILAQLHSYAEINSRQVLTLNGKQQSSS